MQIVIDIDDEDYKRIQGISDVFNSLTSRTYSAIKNGTPLPKGHGRLIDVSNLLTVTDIREDGTESTYVPYEEIEDAPTIVEAEKTESRDKTN